MATKVEELLATLLIETTTDLIKRIRSGEATAADVKNARELLKDNNITADIGEEGNELDILNQELPFAKPLALVGR